MILLLSTIGDEQTRNKVEEVYRLYRKLLYYTAYDVLKDYHEAEDVVQSAIIKICDHIHKFDDIKCNKMKGFLVILVRNLAINIYNQRKRRSDLNMDKLENVTNDDLNPEQYMLKIDNAEWVAQKLAQLNPEYADVLVLRYTYQFTIDEIACLMNLTENNVRVKLCRARKALQELLKGDYHERESR
jgi:RNA polymerase sigma-70 factor (ECF subfamily)